MQFILTWSLSRDLRKCNNATDDTVSGVFHCVPAFHHEVHGAKDSWNNALIVFSLRDWRIVQLQNATEEQRFSNCSGFTAPFAPEIVSATWFPPGNCTVRLCHIKSLQGNVQFAQRKL